MNRNSETAVNRVLGTLAGQRWGGSADPAALGARLSRPAPLARGRRRAMLVGALAMLGAAGLAAAGAALWHSIPTKLEIERDGRVVFSGDTEVHVVDGQVQPIVVQTEDGPMEIPIQLPDGVNPESVIGMKLKVAMSTGEGQPAGDRTFPVTIEVEQQGVLIYTGAHEAHVVDGAVEPITVQTPAGPVTVPSSAFDNPHLSSTTGMKLRIGLPG
jgi:hypothetical protein